MKAVLGLGMIVSGVALGLYVGGWVMFVGGIIQLVQSITPHVIASGIAIGLVKIVFASFVGCISAMVLIFPGAVLARG